MDTKVDTKVDTDVKSKCVIILSTKSSGSTALQQFLASSSGARTVRHTRHFESETLYWTKAASVLGLPQLSMPDSEVPLPPGRARRELVAFLNANISGYRAPESDDELVFGGWAQLCRAHAPALLEKSPHHLYQRSALELLLESFRRTPELEVRVLGLVRHPMSAIYSAWRRWRTLPEVQEQVWLTSYRNLPTLQEPLGDRFSIIRYEDFVTEPAVLGPTLEFLKVPASSAGLRNLHSASLERWRQDPHFGFRPSAELVALAETFGYDPDSLTNRSRPLWPVRKHVLRGLYKGQKTVKTLGKAALKPFRGAFTLR